MRKGCSHFWRPPFWRAHRWASHVPKAWAEWEEALIEPIREPEPVDHLGPELARLAGCRKAQFTPAAQTILLTAGPTDASAQTPHRPRWAEASRDLWSAARRQIRTSAARLRSVIRQHPDQGNDRRYRGKHRERMAHELRGRDRHH
jgi:hypothetical protein